MKKIILPFLLLATLLSNAQDFQGKAEYIIKYVFDKDVSSVDNIPQDPKFKEALLSALKNSSEKSYTLTFSKFEALYEENEVLDKPQAGTNNGFNISVSFSEVGKKYINSKDKFTLTEDEIFGKEFLIEQKLQQPAWNLREESKKIGDYTCFKAELTIPTY